MDEEGFLSFSGREYLKQGRPQRQEQALSTLSKIINTLGERSAVSQKLKQVITSTTKFYGTDQRIYIKVAGTKALGFVKVGEKKLFYHDYVSRGGFRLASSGSSLPLPSLISTCTRAASAPALAR